MQLEVMGYMFVLVKSHYFNNVVKFNMKERNKRRERASENNKRRNRQDRKRKNKENEKQRNKREVAFQVEFHNMSDYQNPSF